MKKYSLVDLHLLIWKITANTPFTKRGILQYYVMKANEDLMAVNIQHLIYDLTVN